jgi:nucleotide-binding universal stress UspA family protein
MCRLRRCTMKPIVLATDGSPSAAEATVRAVELARTLHAPLVAVAVEHVTIPAYGYYGYGELVSELRKADCEHVDTTLRRAAAVAAEHDVEFEGVHGFGPVVDEICHVAKQRGAQMIVVGAHGWGPVRRMLHGSISTAVLHEAHCPVLVVPSVPVHVAEGEQMPELAAKR